MGKERDINQPDKKSRRDQFSGQFEFHNATLIIQAAELTGLQPKTYEEGQMFSDRLTVAEGFTAVTFNFRGPEQVSEFWNNHNLLKDIAEDPTTFE